MAFSIFVKSKGTILPFRLRILGTNLLYFPESDACFVLFFILPERLSRTFFVVEDFIVMRVVDLVGNVSEIESYVPFYLSELDSDEKILWIAQDGTQPYLCL